ncbi:hypothetical protein [Streptomyces massasporeus]|uniref:hypothetical protein n=1 Tax=Streptomyces massasporeus TaxID=67324 RepID=UPI00167AD3AD|nr:hypothetical protein [Streptomyces massasporeus]GGV90658.1 hypothetical protein GCM10010228_79470 [Streptomyces massasporeus]
MSDGDGLFVFWTGHCRLSAEGALQLALAPSPGRTSTDWLTARDLVQAMTRSRSRDRLLILDACLAPDATEGSSVHSSALRREVERLGKAGIAVLSSIDSSPFSFAVNSQAPSVFIQHLTSLLDTLPRATGETLALPDLHRLLARSLGSNGYPRPMLRNAQSFQRPVVTLRTNRRSDSLMARRGAQQSRAAFSRYALAVAGSALRSAAAPNFCAYEPAADAAEIYRSLLDSRCGFTPGSTSLFTAPPTRESLTNAVRGMAEHSQNMLLVYLACHGTVESSGRDLDLALTLGDHETVLASTLVNDLRKAHAESVVLMLDVYSPGATAPATPLTRHNAYSQRRPGFSRVFIEWMNIAVQSRPRKGLPWECDDEAGSLARWHCEQAPQSTTRGGFNWLFDFPGAAIHYLDDSGPLEHFTRQLRDSPAQSLLTYPSEMLSTMGDEPLLDDTPPWAGEVHTYFSASRPSTPSRTVRPPSAAQEETSVPAATSARADNAPPLQRPTHRRHRARLRVTEGSLPLRVGRRLRVTFNYQPQDDDWNAPEDSTLPVDITLRIGAGTAAVDRSIIHTRLTDDQGTPPEEFGITPQSATPVTLRIDVVRKADGAMIQRVERVLKVAAGDGADR